MLKLFFSLRKLPEVGFTAPTRSPPPCCCGLCMIFPAWCLAARLIGQLPALEALDSTILQGICRAQVALCSGRGARSGQGAAFSRQLFTLDLRQSSRFEAEQVEFLRFDDVTSL